MLDDGNKGVVLQKDGKTYAIAPHLPCGLVEPAMLRKIAEVAETFGAALKCTSAQRIAIIGLREDQVDAAWKALGGENPGHLTGQCVRSVRACPGSRFCKRGRQDALAMGLKLDAQFHGKSLAGKMKMGVSGCGNQCADTSIKDIALVGGAKGWNVLVGGCGGVTPRLAKELTDSEVSDTVALEMVGRLVEFFAASARPGERMGELVQRVGMAAVRQAAGVGVQ